MERIAVFVRLVISRITRQGTPTATTLAGMDLETTLPVPMMELSPMVIGQAISSPALRCSGSTGCPAVVKRQFGAMNTWFPNVTLAPSVVIRLWLV
jgi:hypothetical protein